MENLITGDEQMIKCSNIDSSQMTSMHAQSRIENLFEVESVMELARLVAEQKNFYLLGGGSNTVFAGNPVKTPVIKLGKCFEGMRMIGEKTIYVGAATSTTRLLKLSIEKGLSGLEFLWGIPGQIGGAIFMNAGAQGQGILDAVSSIDVIDKTGAYSIDVSDLDSGYRLSGLEHDTVIIGAHLDLQPSTTAQVKENIERMRQARANQPKGYSCGCIFKNPPQDSAGRLIDAAGLKGLRIGDAHISEKHANFIINDGGASGEEISRLIELAKKRVNEIFDVELEEEVKIIV